MRHKSFVLMACAVIFLASAGTFAQLAPYFQDFEGLDQSSPTALTEDGWLVFGIDPNGGYGPFPAPNGGAGFCGIDIGQGGPDQGEQQLVVYNDYNNPFHNSSQLVEANVFQEQRIGAGDVGDTWTFKFDAKRGNIEPDTAALAFIKTLDPNAFFLTRFPIIDLANTPDTWQTYEIPLLIEQDIVDNIFQIGFLTTTTDFTPSGIFYDNISLSLTCEGDDGVSPVIEFLSARLRIGEPVSMYVRTTDDDGFAGGVVAERAYLNDCLVFDGATFGDADGLLTDELLEVSEEEARAALEACGIFNRPTSASFEAEDCAGNITRRYVRREKGKEPEVFTDNSTDHGEDSQAGWIQQNF